MLTLDEARQIASQHVTKGETHLEPWVLANDHEYMFTWAWDDDDLNLLTMGQCGMTPLIFVRKDTGAVARIGSSEVPQRISGMIQVAGPKPPYDDDEWWAKREQEAVYARMRAVARAEREEYAQTSNVPFEDSVPTNAAIDAAGMPWSNAYREFVSIYRMTPEEHLASVGID